MTRCRVKSNKAEEISKKIQKKKTGLLVRLACPPLDSNHPRKYDDWNALCRCQSSDLPSDRSTCRSTSAHLSTSYCRDLPPGLFTPDRMAYTQASKATGVTRCRTTACHGSLPRCYTNVCDMVKDKMQRSRREIEEQYEEEEHTFWRYQLF